MLLGIVITQAGASHAAAAYIGYGSPHKQDTAAAHASRWARRRCASPNAMRLLDHDLAD
jgi:hypothetical protein